VILQFRHVHPDEADILSQIAYSAKAHWGYPERWLEIWKPQLTFIPEYFQTGESWVAVLEEIPIAFYTLHERDGIAWLENLSVLPEDMGKGVGRQLFIHAINRSRASGHKILQLEADPNALGFYEKMGMRKIGGRITEVDGRPRVLPIMEICL
jgi:GNAT superfamily N-acetyltransferase